MCKMSLQYFVMPKRNKILKMQKDGGLAKEFKSQSDKVYSDQNWNSSANKISNVIVKFQSLHIPMPIMTKTRD